MDDPKHVWITGASSGIGRALALKFARSGAAVSASALPDDALDGLETIAEAIHPNALDVTDADMISRTVQELESTRGPIDLAVLNAGIWEQSRPERFDALTAKRLMEVNYLGVANALAAVLPGMIERKSGHIAITASVAGYRGIPRCAYYGPSKAALISLAETLRAELPQQGIKVQVINPCIVDTPMTENVKIRKLFMIDADQAADLIFKGLKSSRFEIAVPKPLAMLWRSWCALPYGLFFRALQAVQSGNVMKPGPGSHNRQN